MSFSDSKEAPGQPDLVDEKSSAEDVAVPVVGYGDSEALDASHDVFITGHPWRIKGPALACVLLMTLGSNFASSSISPLKSTLKKHSENKERLRVPRRPSWDKHMTPQQLDRQEKDAFLEWRRGIAQ